MEKQHYQYIFDYLRNKKFPMDLALEIRDHMAEQVTALMDDGQDFDSSFKQVLSEWQKDLAMQKSIFPARRITAIQRDINNEVNGEIVKNTLLYFLPFMILSIGLSVYNFNFFKIEMLCVYFVATIISVVLIVPEYKLFRSSEYLNRGIRISVYQNGSTLFSMCSINVLMFNLLFPSSKFENYWIALNQLIDGNFSFTSVFNVVFLFIFLLGWFVGVQYFIKYRNAYKLVKSKTNFRL